MSVFDSIMRKKKHKDADAEAAWKSKSPISFSESKHLIQIEALTTLW